MPWLRVLFSLASRPRKPLETHWKWMQQRAVALTTPPPHTIPILHGRRRPWAVGARQRPLQERQGRRRPRHGCGLTAGGPGQPSQVGCPAWLRARQSPGPLGSAWRPLQQAKKGLQAPKNSALAFPTQRGRSGRARWHLGIASPPVTLFRSSHPPWGAAICFLNGDWWVGCARLSAWPSPLSLHRLVFSLLIQADPHTALLSRMRHAPMDENQALSGMRQFEMALLAMLERFSLELYHQNHTQLAGYFMFSCKSTN